MPVVLQFYLDLTMNSMILVVHISRTNDAVKPGLDFLVTDNGNSAELEWTSKAARLEWMRKTSRTESEARLQSPLHAPSSFQAVRAYSQTLKLSETLGRHRLTSLRLIFQCNSFYYQ